MRFSWFKALPLAYKVAGGLGILLVLFIGFRTVTRPAAQSAATPPATTYVSVESVAALSAPSGPLPVVGTVTATDQATILAQTSGQLTSLPVALGASVSAGQILASFDNASQQAAVEEAQGAYDAALVGLDRVGGTSAENTTATVLAALASGYSSIDDAVHTRADQLFTNPRTASPSLNLTVPDATLVSTLNTERASLDPVLADLRMLAQEGTATTTSVAALSAEATGDVRQVLAFLDNLVKAVNETQPSQSASATTLASYQTSLAAARTETVAVLSGITTAKSAYDANSVSAAQASVKQAAGALAAAKAALEKTLVRAPISGLIVSLPVSQGDYVTTNSEVAVVSNPGSLYIDANVTSSDAKTLSVGNAATIGSSTRGVITFIAPALDPSTGKIEVKAGIVSGASALTAGEVVPVSFARTSVPVARQDAQLTIPIIAAKILPTGPAVFTVSTSSALVAHPITLGTILGDRVVVTAGLTLDMRIVTDARGLAEGQQVEVDTATTTATATTTP